MVFENFTFKNMIKDIMTKILILKYKDVEHYHKYIKNCIKICKNVLITNNKEKNRIFFMWESYAKENEKKTLIKFMLVYPINFQNQAENELVDSIVVVFSVVDNKSFKNGVRKIEMIRQEFEFEKPLFLVANKVDQARQRVVTEKGRYWIE